MTALDAVPDAMRRFHVPGVAVGVLRDASADLSTADIATFGVTSVENPLPIQPTTLFQIGSITKTITATMLMRLVEQGKVELEAPIRRYLPDFRLQDDDVAQRATVRHLVTHTGGWVGDDFNDTGSGDDALARYVAGLADLPQLAPLGALWSYCNSGFAVAGRIVEVVCDQPYEVAARELVLEPLGMRHSYFLPTDAMTHRFVVGHISPFAADGAIQVARPWPLARAANSMGGLISCVPDLLRYARFFLRQGKGEDDRQVLAPETVRLMQSPLAPAGNYAESVGVAWMLRSLDGARVVEHGGGTWGQQTTLKLLPEQNYAQVILTNASRGGELHGWLSARLLEEHLGLHTTLPEPIALPPEQLAEYEGHYEGWADSFDVTIAAPDAASAQATADAASAAETNVATADHGASVLVLQDHDKGGFPTRGSPPGPPRPPARFGVWSPDHLIGLEPPSRGAHAEFLRSADGAITYLRIGGRLARRT
jgi:CubicO group peptidase (beta-lactamase class C family)